MSKKQSSVKRKSPEEEPSPEPKKAKPRPKKEKQQEHKGKKQTIKEPTKKEKDKKKKEANGVHAKESQHKTDEEEEEKEETPEVKEDKEEEEDEGDKDKKKQKPKPKKPRKKPSVPKEKKVKEKKKSKKDGSSRSRTKRAKTTSDSPQTVPGLDRNPNRVWTRMQLPEDWEQEPRSASDETRPCGTTMYHFQASCPDEQHVHNPWHLDGTAWSTEQKKHHVGEKGELADVLNTFDEKAAKAFVEKNMHHPYVNVLAQRWGQPNQYWRVFHKCVGCGISTDFQMPPSACLKKESSGNKSDD